MFNKTCKHGLVRFTNERGQNLVEFALVAPILIMLFMGIFDFGWVLHKQISLDNAVRAGARRAAVGQDNTIVKSVVRSTCSFPVTDDQITIDVRNSEGSSIGNPNDRTPDNYFYIAVNVNDVQLITPLQAFADMIGQINLHANSTYMIE